MATAFQEGLGLQKKAAAAPKATPYQGLNVKDFVGLGGTHEPTPQELLLVEIEQQKQKLLQEEAAFTACTSALKESFEKMKQDFETAKAQLSQNLLELAFFLAREIVDYELSTEPTMLSHMIQKILDQSLLTEQRTLHMSPADHALIKEKNPEFLSKMETEKIILLEDPSLQSGHVKVTSPSRQLETDFQKRLLEIKKQIPGNFLASFKTTTQTPGGDHA